jgi:hypothetical protein
MAIEVIKTDTEPFEILYDKTGTKGDPGDRRIIDSGNTKQPTATPTATPEAQANSDTKNVVHEALDSLFNTSGFQTEFRKGIKATVEEKKDKLIVHVNFSDSSDSKPYKNDDRKNLLDRIKEQVKSRTSLDNVKQFALPPSEDQLNIFTTEFNETATDLKFKVAKIEVEADGKHKCTYEKNKINEKPTEEQETDFKEKVKEKFTTFCEADSSIGKREIDLNLKAEENK